MADNTITTLEEAKLCPKCGRTGEVRKEAGARSEKTGDRVKLLYVYCVTELCKWFGTPWIVQVNEDGSIPAAYSGVLEKAFPRISEESASKIEDNVRRQLDAETNRGGHGEINNPRG